jgi:hypothetical protein
VRISDDLNNSFVHGIGAFATFALLGFLNVQLAVGAGSIVGIFAGWFPRSHLASFLVGVMLAVVVWGIVGGLVGPPGAGTSAVVIVPVVLAVAFLAAFGAFMLGKCAFIVWHLKR